MCQFLAQKRCWLSSHSSENQSEEKKEEEREKQKRKNNKKEEERIRRRTPTTMKRRGGERTTRKKENKKTEEERKKMAFQHFQLCTDVNPNHPFFPLIFQVRLYKCTYESADSNSGQTCVWGTAFKSRSLWHWESVESALCWSDYGIGMISLPCVSIMSAVLQENNGFHFSYTVPLWP